MSYIERWEVKTVRVQDGVKEDKDYLIDLLDVGWEPFSATTLNTSTNYYHLRRFIYERVGD